MSYLDKSIKSKIVCIIISVLICGCTGYQYIPSPNYIPLNTRKGEIKVNIASNSLQVGYSVSNHWSVFGTAFFRLQLGSYESALSSENRGTHIRFDSSYSEYNIGLSYFIYKNNSVFEVLAGGGFGNIDYFHKIDLYPDYTSGFNAKKYDFYIQPNFGVSLTKHLTLGMFSKFSYNYYYNMTSWVQEGAKYEVDPEDKFFLGKETNDFIIAEPGLFVKLGNKAARFQAVLAPAFGIDQHELYYRKVNLFLSFSFCPSDLAKKNKFW